MTGLLKEETHLKKVLDGVQETYFRSIPGTSDNDTSLWCNTNMVKVS